MRQSSVISVLLILVALHSTIGQFITIPEVVDRVEIECPPGCDNDCQRAKCTAACKEREENYKSALLAYHSDELGCFTSVCYPPSTPFYDTEHYVDVI